MRGPHDQPGRGSRARRAAAAEKRRRFPIGKALARIQYFETQRGLALTRREGRGILARRVRIESASRRARSGRAAARRGAPSTVVGARYLSAFRHRAKLAPTFPGTVGLPLWRPLGPSLIPHGQTYGRSRPPVSGRCSGIVVDPADGRRLLLCSAGGGVWGSQDAGQTWRALTDDQPVLTMGAIALAPSSPNIVYAGTGDGDGQVSLGTGLLRSSDGGATWTHLPAAELAGVGIYDLAVHPTDPLRVWVAADAGCFESRDGGRKWRVVRRDACWKVSIHPRDPREILIAAERGLLRSGNEGSTWSLVPLPGAEGATFARLEVCHAPSAPQLIYAAGVLDDDEEEGALLWRRARAGGAFAPQRAPAGMDVTQAWYDWCLAVAPDDPDRLYWGAIELYRGTRGTGDAWRWENISSRSSGDSIHGDQHFLAFDPSNARTLYACNDGGLFRSPDAGNSWASLNPGLAITEFEFLVHLESRDAWLMGGTQDNGTVNLKADPTWDQVALGDGGDCGVAESSAPLCYHSYYAMWIERAPAVGPTAFRWKEVTPPRLRPRGVVYEALFYPPMDVVGATVAKAGKTVFVSGDSGDHWDEIPLPTSGDDDPDLASALVIVDARTIYLGTVGGALYRISRGAAGWKRATVNALQSPRQAYLSDIVVLGAARKEIWVSCSAVGGGHVFRSSDGAQTWTNRTGNLPDMPVNAIVVDPKDARCLYAATDHGVYRSKDAGGRWSDFSNGLPNVIVSDLILHERLRRLRAGTKSRGAWEVKI